MELITQLGINWKLLIAQVINFFILLFVLYRFAYKPILRMLNKRTATIEKSLDDAKQIERNLAESAKEKEAALKSARQQAQKILDEVMQKAEALRQEKLKLANAEVEEIVKRTKAELAQAKITLVKEAQAEVADVVVQAVEKILLERLDEKKDRELVQRALAEIVKQKA
ncbi:MAG: F0F1 ATP synthase subunit B [Patescibacteria group bacterium]